MQNVKGKLFRIWLLGALISSISLLFFNINLTSKHEDHSEINFPETGEQKPLVIQIGPENLCLVGNIKRSHVYAVPCDWSSFLPYELAGWFYSFQTNRIQLAGTNLCLNYPWWHKRMVLKKDALNLEHCKSWEQTQEFALKVETKYGNEMFHLLSDKSRCVSVSKNNQKRPSIQRPYAFPVLGTVCNFPYQHSLHHITFKPYESFYPILSSVIVYDMVPRGNDMYKPSKPFLLTLPGGCLVLNGTSLSIELCQDHMNLFYFEEHGDHIRHFVTQEILHDDRKFTRKFPKYAYVSFIDPTIDYGCGLIQLGYALRRSGTPFSLIVLVPKGTETELYERHGWIVHEIERIENPMKDLPAEDQGVMFFMWENMFSKLYLWTLPYDRVVYIDADVLPRKNLDFLFHRCEKSICGAPNDESGEMFNGGLMVLKPDPSVFETLIQKLSETRKFNFAEMGFLNDFFRDDKEILQDLYMVFQVGRKHLEPDLWEIAHVLHYTCFKPWNCPLRAENCEPWECVGDVTPLYDYWWRSFDVLPHQAQRDCGVNASDWLRIQTGNIYVPG